MIAIQCKLFTETSMLPRQIQGKNSVFAYDIFANDRLKIEPFGTAMVKTGIGFSIDNSFIIKIFPFSSCLNFSPFVLDHSAEICIPIFNQQCPSFWGELMSLQDPRTRSNVSMFGFTDTVEIKHGDKIARVTVEKCEPVNFEPIVIAR